MRLLFFIICPLILLTSCHGNNGRQQELQHDASATDSNTIRLALMPTLDCLPFYYACRSGIYDSVGVAVRISTYRSQMDCDTALMGTTVDGGFSDLVRAAYYKERSKFSGLDEIICTDGQWALLSSGKLRMKSVEKLKKRMVAVGRLSASDYYSNAAITSANLGYDDVFRPQINDLYLRTSMLNDNQIDAAVLPEPFISWAVSQGHRVLYKAAADKTSLGAVFIKNKLLADSLKKGRVELLLKAYDKAVDRLTAHRDAIVDSVLLRDFCLPQQVADSLRIPKYHKARVSQEADREKARSFVRQHR